MMEWKLLLWNGNEIQLSSALEWRLEYTAGVPCDSFYAVFPWRPGTFAGAERAVELTVLENGACRFRGVVDEIEHRLDGTGGRLVLSGRGMAALLLDNEAEPADYLVVTEKDIIRDHVSPYGIEVAEEGSLPAVNRFSVSSGSSEWQVLYEYARYYGGVTPRFDREGRLVLTTFPDDPPKMIDEAAAVTKLVWREKRYGVLSEILVRDRSRQAVERVVNSGFLAEGGRRRGVLNTPSRSNYLAMRYSGEFQLKRSESQRRRVELTVPSLFFAWPGELLRLSRPDWGVSGIWRVLEARVEADEKGRRTTLTLGTPEALI